MITKNLFGTLNGENVYKYTLLDEKTNGTVEIIEYGATVTSIKVPDKNGELTDVVLGFDDMNGYLACKDYFGATIGRCGNRIGNATFILNGKTYNLYANTAPDHLHGGKVGFDKKIWKSKQENDKVSFYYFSEDGEENYPGDLDVKVTFSFVDGALSIDYRAVSSQDTVCNLTNHSYFNLNGQGSGSMEDNYLKINAKQITPMNVRLITDGSYMDVKNTPFDFTEFKQIGKDIRLDDIQLTYGSGYDHNFVLDKKEDEFGLCAQAYSEKTGIFTTVKTTLPGVQFYAGNCINDIVGKNNASYTKRSAFCLETQCHPNAINCPAYPNVVLRRGDVYQTKTEYAFSIINE